MVIELQRQKVSDLCKRWTKKPEYILGLAQEDKLSLWVELFNVAVFHDDELWKKCDQYKIRISGIILAKLASQLSFSLLLEEVLGYNTDGRSVAVVDQGMELHLEEQRTNAAPGFPPVILLCGLDLYAHLPDVEALDKEFFDTNENPSKPIEQQPQVILKGDINEEFKARSKESESELVNRLKGGSETNVEIVAHLLEEYPFTRSGVIESLLNGYDQSLQDTGALRKRGNKLASAAGFKRLDRSEGYKWVKAG